MHGKKLSVLAALLLTLSGCARQDTAMQRALDLRTALTAAGGCAFAAQAKVNYGEEIFRFSMDCAYEAGGGVTIRLTEPQTLAGIGAEVSADGARVAYEDTEVGFAELAGGRVSPMRLPYLLAESWYRGYISACGWEDGVLRATYLLGYDDNEITVDTWLDASGLPVRAAVSYQGQTLLKAELHHFSLERGNQNENSQKNMGGGVSG